MRTMQDAFIITSILAVLVTLAIMFFWPPMVWAFAIILPLVLLGWRDIAQKKHTILRLYPVLGHFRFMLESIRPEIQQYFVEDDTSGMPVNREFRSLVYQRAKGERDTRPFGTQFDIYRVGYEWTNHSLYPQPIPAQEPRILFGEGNCREPYEAALFNVSAMSYGALSKNAILALNLGAKLGNFYHNTGEGGVSPYHLEHQGDLVWQIGTGYFSCRHHDGRFNREMFAERVKASQIKMIEIKLSQGAKPGHGGLLPGSKVNEEVAAIRGVKVGQDVVSPPGHSAFDTPLELMEFVQDLREISGKPVGFKLAVGRHEEFLAICKAMLQTDIVPDFITVDGGEGGTGAAPIEFSNSMGTPMREAINIVHSALVGCGLRDRIRIVASGKVFSAFHVFRALALGADTINSARGMMFALGCIQSRHCNTDKCPTGVATQDPKRYKALDVFDKAQRVANYQSSIVYHLQKMVGASGLCCASEVSARDVFRRVSATEVKNLAEIYPVMPKGALLNEETVPEKWQAYWELANPNYWTPRQAQERLEQGVF